MSLTPAIEAVLSQAVIFTHLPVAQGHAGGRISLLVPGFQWRMLDIDQALKLRAAFYGWPVPGIANYGCRAAHVLEGAITQAGFANRIFCDGR